MSKKCKQVEIYLSDVNETVIATWEKLAENARTTVELFKRDCKELEQRGYIKIREV